MPWTDNAAAGAKPGQQPTREWGPWGAVEPADAGPPAPASPFADLIAAWRRWFHRAPR
jgi:hypothetical protein